MDSRIPIEFELPACQCAGVPSDEVSSGRKLCQEFFTDCVRPVLDAHSPGLPYAAALLGRGSEVLGYDDAMSLDHNVEPRVLIFVSEDDHHRYAADLRTALAERIPETYAGRPCQYGITTIRGYLREQLDIDLDLPIRAIDWLTWPESRLIMITGGMIFHDRIGLGAALERFRYYPDDVWYYLMIAGWWRLHPEVNLVGRTGYVGDEIGSSIIGSRLVHDLMQLCFLLERRYAPYDKWFGTAFARLDCGPKLLPVLRRVLRSDGWRDREQALQAAYVRVAALHNALRITDPVPVAVERMWGRPFGVLWGDFSGALRRQLKDPDVIAVAEAFPVGGIERPRELLGISRGRLVRLFAAD